MGEIKHQSREQLLSSSSQFLHVKYLKDKYYLFSLDTSYIALQVILHEKEKAIEEHCTIRFIFYTNEQEQGTRHKL